MNLIIKCVVFFIRIIEKCVKSLFKTVAVEVDQDVKHGIIEHVVPVEGEVLHSIEDTDIEDEETDTDVEHEQHHNNRKKQKKELSNKELAHIEKNLEGKLEKDGQKLAAGVEQTIRHVTGEIEHVESTIVYDGKKELKNSAKEIKNEIHKLEQSGSHVVHKGHEKIDHLKREVEHGYHSIEQSANNVVHKIGNVVEHTANTVKDTLVDATSSLTNIKKTIENQVVKELDKHAHNLGDKVEKEIKENTSFVSKMFTEGEKELRDLVSHLSDTSQILERELKYNKNRLSDVPELDRKFHALYKSFRNIKNKINPNSQPQSTVSLELGANLSALPFNTLNAIKDIYTLFGCKVKSRSHIVKAEISVKMNDNTVPSIQLNTPKINISFQVPEQLNAVFEHNVKDASTEGSFEIVNVVKFTIKHVKKQIDHAANPPSYENKFEAVVQLLDLIEINCNLSENNLFKNMKLNDIFGFLFTKMLRKKSFQLYGKLLKCYLTYDIGNQEFILEVRILDSNGSALLTITMNFGTWRKEKSISAMFKETMEVAEIKADLSLLDLKYVLRN